MNLFVKIARRRRDSDMVSHAESIAVGVQAGWTGKWDAIKALARKVRGPAGAEGRTMSHVRDQIRSFLGSVAPKKRRRE